MDSKTPPSETPVEMNPSPPWRRNRRSVLAGMLLVTIVYACLWWDWLDPWPVEHRRWADKEIVAMDKLVPLEAHIISKCPDTRDALRLLVLPVMQRIYNKVDFTLSYIGRPTSNDGVECKHGPSECMGNILELCAHEVYPNPKIYLGFTMCLTRDYPHIPERSLVEDCALEHAVDIEALDECATRDDGAHGMELLRDSVNRTAEAGVTRSATIRLNNEIYCIRDDYKWMDCPHGAGVNDLVIAIEKLYQS